MHICHEEIFALLQLWQVAPATVASIRAWFHKHIHRHHRCDEHRRELQQPKLSTSR